MLVLNERARLICPHPSGIVQIEASQDFVTIDGASALVEPDPVGKDISGCLNHNPMLGIHRCSKTLAVSKGYSDWVSIEGRPVCLDTVTGHTISQPPMAAKYIVAEPGQDFVSSDQ